MRRGIIVSALRRHGYTRMQARFRLHRFSEVIKRCDREEDALEDLLEADVHNCTDECPCDVDDIMFCKRLREAADRTYAARKAGQ